MAAWTCGSCGATASGDQRLVDMIILSHKCPPPDPNEVVHSE